MNDWMVDAIVSFFNGISGFDQGKVGVGALSQPLSTFSAPAFEATRAISDTIVRPIASVVLSLMLVVELSRNASKMEGDGQQSVKMIAGTMFRFVLLIVAVQYANDILTAIYEIAQAIIEGVGASYPVEGGSAATEGALGDRLRETIKGLSFGDQFNVFFYTVIPYLITGLAGALAYAMILLRFIELYLLSCFAPLPLAFAGHPDTKQVSVGYLRHFAAAAMQGATLMIALFMYRQVATETINPDALISGEMSIAQWTLTNQPVFWGGGILLILLILGSNRLAKAIVGM